MLCYGNCLSIIVFIFACCSVTRGDYDQLLALNSEGILTAENLEAESDEENQTEKKTQKPKARKPRTKKSENQPVKRENKQDYDPVLIEDSPPLIESASRKRPYHNEDVKPSTSRESPPVRPKIKKTDSFEDSSPGKEENDSSGVDSQGWQVYDPRAFEEELRPMRKTRNEVDDSPAAARRNTPGITTSTCIVSSNTGKVPRPTT